MESRRNIILPLMLLLLLLASCSERARIIPQGKMAKIYAEMFVADQWVMVNPAVRKQADTSLFYEPIFRKYGYTFKDYNASVEHYLLDPDTYVKILTQTSQILDSRLEQARSLKEIEDGAKAFNARIRGYENRDFSDSLAWKPLLEAWRKEASAFADTTDSIAPVLADSLAAELQPDSCAVVPKELADTLEVLTAPAESLDEEEELTVVHRPGRLVEPVERK